MEEMRECLDHVPPFLKKHSFFLDQHEENARNFCGCVREELEQIVSPGEMKYFYPEVKEFIPFPDATKRTTEEYMRVSRAAEPLREADIAKTFVQNCVNENKKITPKETQLISPLRNADFNFWNRMNGFLYNFRNEDKYFSPIWNFFKEEPNSGHYFHALTNTDFSKPVRTEMAIGAAFCHTPSDLWATLTSLVTPL